MADRTFQVVCVMPQAQSQAGSMIMHQFLQALAAAGAERGYRVLVTAPSGDPRDEIRRLIDGRAADAFILTDAQPGDPRADVLAEARVPFACFGRTGQALPQCWVDVDNHGAVAAAVEHVLARGYRRLAYVGWRPASDWDAERAAGFRTGLERHGRRAAENGVLLTDEATELRKIRSLITEVRPDAVVAGSDRLAAIVYGVAAQAGLRVGGDLAVTGFDDCVPASLLHPRLTSVAIPVAEIACRVLDRVLRQLGEGQDLRPGLSTVAQPLERSGAEGARRLCALLRGERVTPLRQELPLELIPRASSARADPI